MEKLTPVVKRIYGTQDPLESDMALDISTDYLDEIENKRDKHRDKVAEELMGRTVKGGAL